MTVILQHASNRSEDLLIAEDLAFQSCVDVEYPVERGTLAFLQGKMEVGTYPFMLGAQVRREVLLIWRSNVNSLECAVKRALVTVNPRKAQVVTFDAYSGNDELLGMAVTFEGSHHELTFNKVYDLDPGHYEVSLTSSAAPLVATLDIRAGNTYVVTTTGVSQGLQGEPTPVGLMMHGVDSFDVAENSPVVAHKVQIQKHVNHEDHKKKKGLVLDFLQAIPHELSTQTWW